MDKYAILDGREVKVLTGPNALMEWTEFTKKFENQRIAKTDFPDGVTVSTVFLGLNLSWDPGEQLWFESMVFGGTEDGHMDRYSTYDQAVRGHDRIVRDLTALGGESI